MTTFNNMMEELGKYHVIGLFSGGKDSLTACHYLWSMGLLKDVLYLKTGIGLKENIEFVENTCKKFKWNLIVLEPDQNHTYEKFIQKFGFPHPRIHNWVYQYLKHNSLRRFAKEHKDDNILFISGRRYKESKRRQKHKNILGIQQVEKYIKIYSVLHDWSDNRVWKYLEDNKLNICPVYETLHISGDCLCGSYVHAENLRLVSIFHPETAKYLRSLEKKYKGVWGADKTISLNGISKESKLEAFVCSECFFDNNKINNNTGEKK